MTAQEIGNVLDRLLEGGETEKAEAYLISLMEKAKREEDYASYIVIGNEMIVFYRRISGFEKAFAAAEDVLLLMEELQMDQSAHFTETLLNAASVYMEAGQPRQAYACNAQAAGIYERILPFEREERERLETGYGMALTGAGEACYRMGDYENSLRFYEKALREVESQWGKGESYAMLCKNCSAVCGCLGAAENNRATAGRRSAEEYLRMAEEYRRMAKEY